MVFDFNDYRVYLNHTLSQAGSRSGLKATCAKAVGIKSSFLSIVLSGKAHLNLEQAFKIGQFFNHTEEESHYFLLLVQKSRASTTELSAYFEKQLARTKKKQGLKHTIKAVGEVSTQQKALYYSSWIYAAVHVAISIPQLRTRHQLHEYFNLPIRRMNEVVDFLIQSGLVSENRNKLSVEKFGIHLSPGSPELFQHHIAWRMKTAEIIAQRDLLEDFHYSSVVSLSKSDVKSVRDILAKGLASALDIVKESKEESLYSMNIDFFQLNNQ